MHRRLPWELAARVTRRCVGAGLLRAGLFRAALVAALMSFAVGCTAPATSRDDADRGGWLFDSAVTDLVFARDGRSLVVGLDDGRVVVVDAHTIRVDRELRAVEATVEDGDVGRAPLDLVVTHTWFAPRGEAVAWTVESPSESELRVVEAATGRSRRVVASNDASSNDVSSSVGERVEALAFSRDGERIAAGLHDGSVWSSGLVRGDRTVISTPAGDASDGSVLALAFDAEGCVVVRGAWHDLRISGVSDTAADSGATWHAAEVLALESTDAGIVLVARADADDASLVARTAYRAEVHLDRTMRSVTRVRVSANGELVAVQGSDGVLDVFDLSDGHRLFSTVLDSCTFDVRGRFLAGIDTAGAAVVIDARDGARIERLEVAEPDVVTAVALDADARRLAAGTEQGALHVWALAH